MLLSNVPQKSFSQKTPKKLPKEKKLELNREHHNPRIGYYDEEDIVQRLNRLFSQTDLIPMPQDKKIHHNVYGMETFSTITEYRDKMLRFEDANAYILALKEAHCVNWQVEKNSGKTLLHEYLEKAWYVGAFLLIYHGASVEIVDKNSNATAQSFLDTNLGELKKKLGEFSEHPRPASYDSYKDAKKKFKHCLRYLKDTLKLNEPIFIGIALAYLANQDMPKYYPKPKADNSYGEVLEKFELRHLMREKPHISGRANKAAVDNSKQASGICTEAELERCRETLLFLEATANEVSQDLVEKLKKCYPNLTCQFTDKNRITLTIAFDAYLKNRALTQLVADLENLNHLEILDSGDTSKFSASILPKGFSKLADILEKKLTTKKPQDRPRSQVQFGLEQPSPRKQNEENEARSLAINVRKFLPDINEAHNIAYDIDGSITLTLDANTFSVNNELHVFLQNLTFGQHFESISLESGQTQLIITAEGVRQVAMNIGLVNTLSF